MIVAVQKYFLLPIPVIVDWLLGPLGELSSASGLDANQFACFVVRYICFQLLRINPL